jgi:hypothetical protein
MAKLCGTIDGFSQCQDRCTEAVYSIKQTTLVIGRMLFGLAEGTESRATSAAGCTFEDGDIRTGRRGESKSLESLLD